MAAHHAPQHAVRVRQSSLLSSSSFINSPLKLSLFGQAAHRFYMRALVQRPPRLSFRRCHVSPLQADELAASTSGQLARLTLHRWRWPTSSSAQSEETRQTM